MTPRRGCGIIRHVKRFLDVAFVLLCAPLWAPLALAVAAAVALVDGRPVFFRQERAGLRGRPFSMLKFRTMRPGEGSDAVRTTRLGKMLRASSLDELPQLLHVLSGRMSLVGPRPLPVRYLPLYSAEQARRHDVRPGITGWAQVNGRNDVSWEEKFKMDVWYVDHVSVALDARIMALTVLRVATGSGVNSTTADTMPEFTGAG